MATFTPRVVDISHHNKVIDLTATAASGVWGVIHKSSQGRGYRDPDYAPRRKLAKAAGMLWGAYHFNDGSDVAAQVDWFLKCAQPDDSTLLVLDFEDNTKSNMTVQQAVAFLRLLEQKTGRKGAIYSGNRLKETIGKLSAADRKYLTSHRLWLCQYGPRAVLPKGFSRYWLWQYTGDGVGPPPHNVPGIVSGNRGLDCNVYDGDRAQLASEWAPTGLGLAAMFAAATDDMSSHSRAAAADQPDDDAPAIAPAPALEVAPPNVQPLDPAIDGDPVLLDVQQRLKGRRYPPGILDGKWGGGTRGALSGFMGDRGHKIAIPTSLAEFHEIADEVRAELIEAETEVQPDGSIGWYRPVSEARANAEPQIVKELAPEVAPVKRNFITAIWASIVAAAGAIWETVSGYVSEAWDFFTDHKDVVDDHPGILSTAWGYVTAMPTGFWWLLVAGGLAFIAYNSWRSIKTSLQAVRSGERQ